MPEQGIAPHMAGLVEENILDQEMPFQGDFDELHQQNVFDDDDNIELDDEDEEIHRVMEEWTLLAQDVIANGGMVPPAPLVGPHPLRANGINYIWDNGFGLVEANVFDVPVAVVARPAIRRGNRAIEDGGRHIPAGINPQPQPKRFPPPPPRKYQKAPKLHQYPQFGVKYNGYMFSRELDINEKIILAQRGYHELIRKVPELIYKEKDIPVDENEECVILLSELADHLAVQACKIHIPDFTIEDHTTEYQAVYKRYLKEISAFKRTKNG